MAQIFLTIYRYFQKHRILFWIVFAIVLVLVAAGASRIRIEEDITRFFPDDERVEKLSYVFRNSKFTDRIVVMVSMKDSTLKPDSLVAFTSRLVTALEIKLKPYGAKINSQVDAAAIKDLFNSVIGNLPIFLEEKDYQILDSLTKPEQVGKTLQHHYQQLLSPAGVVTKKIIVNDPLGFSFIVLKKMEQLQYDKNFELYDDYIFTKDHHHLIFFIQPLDAANETSRNTLLIEDLHAIVQASNDNPQIMASYFGAPAVAVANAKQIRKDTILTVSLMIFLLAVVIIGFFRKKRTPFLILIPVVFGGLFSLCCIYLLKGSVSILAIAAGSVILGIAVNYALHFLTHLRHTHNHELVIRDLAMPMTIGSATTVLAFLCLQFVNAGVLRDVGLFAAFSLVGAALCSLILFPHLIKENVFASSAHRESLVEKFFETRVRFSNAIVLVIFLLTPVFLYFAQDVSFNSNIGKLNYMPPDLAEAQQRLEKLNKASLSTVYVVAQEPTMEKALQKNERTIPLLEKLSADGVINKYSSVSSFIISDSLQKVRIERWNNFWDQSKKERVIAQVRMEGAKLKFSEAVLQNFQFLLTTQYKPEDVSFWDPFRKTFYSDHIIEKDNLATVITLVNAESENKEKLYRTLESASSDAFDRQMLTNLFVEYVHEDFNFIVTFTSVLVFLALLISYGRIELTLITFIPMLITWIWILGIMALVGIEFNIVNVMVSTFIFGLGDDYSIFIMDGLQQEYKTGKKNLPSIRTSILLSAITTIAGLGVLIFAQHPALRSIAAIAIIGIVCVLLMSQTIEPFLFRWMITNRAEKGLAPMTFKGFFWTLVTYVSFLLGSFFMTIIGLLLKAIPFGRKTTRLWFHILLSKLIRVLVLMGASVKKSIINKSTETFSRASVIISNHSSFLDILVTTMLHPKLILLTNKWVWNSPVFGAVVRLADYYPVVEGAEQSVDRLRDRIIEGYSVIVFPEGTRSPDGKLKRFHKGAFYLAEVLRIPIRPLLIHGASEGVPKNTIYLNDSHITLKFLSPIEPDDLRFGTTYSERTKSISKYFKEEFKKLSEQQETPDFFRYKLIGNYLYKGPVLEWYLRIKLKLEKNYASFHELVPRKASVLDLGCGYGFLCYMLYFLSEERVITGIDYDQEKIATAAHAYSKNEKLKFIAADITTFTLQQFDVIIMADVLHYLLPDQQQFMIERCLKALNPGGRLIIREGNADLKERHQGTKLTEFFSVTLFGFNKSVNKLHFISGDQIRKAAHQLDFQVKTLDETKYTSNVIFVIEK